MESNACECRQVFGQPSARPGVRSAAAGARRGGTCAHWQLYPSTRLRSERISSGDMVPLGMDAVAAIGSGWVVPCGCRGSGGRQRREAEQSPLPDPGESHRGSPHPARVSETKRDRARGDAVMTGPRKSARGGLAVRTGAHGRDGAALAGSLGDLCAAARAGGPIPEAAIWFRSNAWRVVVGPRSGGRDPASAVGRAPRLLVTAKARLAVPALAHTGG